MKSLSQEQFFLEWLPERLRSASANARVASPVTVAVEVSGSSYLIEAEASNVAVSARNAESPTFRLRLDTPTFERLRSLAGEGAWDQGRTQRLFTLDAETIELIASVPGCLELRVEDQADVFALCFGPGHLNEVGCTIACELGDLERLRAGEVQPLELLMNGKLRIEGDAQIAMALGSLLM